MARQTSALIVATDGACPGNPGPGGWAWVAADGTSGAGGEPAPSTNNRMELTAVLKALEARSGVDVLIQTDSELVVKTFTTWLPGWKERGMRKPDGKPVSNAQLITAIDSLTLGRTVTFEHVRGHSGHALNEAADKLARAEAALFGNGASLAKVEELGTFVCECCFLRRDRSQLSTKLVCRDCE